MVNALPLKDYQQDVLDKLDKYLGVLSKAKHRSERLYQIDLEDNSDDALAPDFSGYCHDAWEKTKSIIELPIYHANANKSLFSNDWKDRHDGIKRKIPNICMKVPTGGGKTLIAACALGRINRDYFNSSRGLVLWVVPSNTIYTQTLKALSDKEHPYRKQLDFESGGKTKILERNDVFNVLDVENYLCVMLLTLQSFNVNKKSKDARKIYSDSGQYFSFFPKEDDYQLNNELLNQIPNLVEEDMLVKDVHSGVTIKQSLGNVFRMCRPIVIIDEEHRAKSPKAIANINEFNPKFILEFSATPREDSNKLVDVGGKSLKQEQMIKLPINVHASEQEDWKSTLNTAHAKLASLSKDSGKLQHQDGTYIRPIMVIIAEPKKKDSDYDQVDEIKKYLVDKCQVLESEIKIKLSDNDEIKEENLLDKSCAVKYIITKDALREGWDCPFAYVLAILTQKNSATALTQYTGRILRQPYAKTTPIESLNQSYVYCTKANVGTAVEKIKKALEHEGMGDVASDVQIANSGVNNERSKVVIKRNDKYKNEIFLPSLTSVLSKDNIKPFDYYRDILGEINWSEYSCSVLPVISSVTKDTGKEMQIDLESDLTGQLRFSNHYGDEYQIYRDDEINMSLLTNQLTEKIPNPFEAHRILMDVLNELREQGKTDKVISAYGHDIVRQIQNNAFEWLLQKSEELFVEKLKNNQILLKLLATPFADLNWEMGQERTQHKNNHEDPAIGWDKSLFQPQYKSNYNGLELDVAGYINQSEAVRWWYRLSTKGTEYCVQGWKKDKIYPDFLIMKHDEKYLFVETKGNHLDNPDSEYKAKVFEHLTEHANKEIGEFKLVSNHKEVSFKLVYDKEYKEVLSEASF